MEKIINLSEVSMSEIGGISIHFSSDCNMACKYCYIEKDKACMASYNRNIRESLKDGSFAQRVKEKFSCIKDQIEDLSLWGAEPTINSKLFKDFCYELLDFFPNARSLMFSTNALLGGDLIYEDFLYPLLEYAENNKRELKFILQLSLDGPPEFNDSSRHEGATAQTLKTLYMMIEKMPKYSDYFTLQLLTKATLDVSYMEIMNAGGVEKFQWYFDFINEVRETAEDLSKDKSTIDCFISLSPTLVDPGWHTVENGKTFAQWLHNLRYVDRSKYHNYEGPLFGQGLSAIGDFLADKNPFAHSVDAYSCSASKNNMTIDYDGNLYTCNRLCRNAALGEPFSKKHAMQSNSTFGGVTEKEWVRRVWGSFSFHTNILSRWQMAQGEIMILAKYGQILPKYYDNEDEQKMLFYFIQGFLCHIGGEEDYTSNPFLLPYSYFRYLGNGALDEMIDYYKLEVSRGNIEPWKIVM